MRHPWRLGAAWGSIGLAWLASPSVASGAEPAPGLALQWRAPAGCPDEAWARKAITGYLGQRKLDAFKPMAVRVEITGVAAGRWRAVLSMGGGASGDRVFEGTTCARVGDAAVLIVALMFDPVEVVTQMDAPGIDASGAPPAPTNRRSDDGRAPARFELGVLVTGDAGSLPEATVGAGLAAGVRMGRISGEVDVVAWIPRRAFGPTAGSGGDIGLTTVSARGCLAVEGALGLALAPCVRLEGGLASGRGFGIAEPVTSRTFWGATFVGLSIRQPSTAPLGPWLLIEGGFPFVRPDYTIEEFGTVFRGGPLLARVSFGLAWSFP